LFDHSSRDVLLFSSAGESVFEQFLLSVLAYPEDHILIDVSYGLNRVPDLYKQNPRKLKNRKALITFLGYRSGEQGVPQPLYFPLRQAVILSSRVFAGKLLLNVKLGKFVYYKERCSEIWHNKIKDIAEAPKPELRKGQAAMVFDVKTSWRSGGFFLMDVDRNLIDIRIDANEEATIREEANDWKSLIDTISTEKPFSEKLFYQIWKVQEGGSSEPVNSIEKNERSMFSVTPGQAIDVILHFYPGKGKHTSNEPSKLSVKVSPELVSLISQGPIEVHPAQTSGKVERVQLLVKRRLSSEITPVIFQEEGASTKTLGRTEVYLKIHSTGLAVAIFGLFFLGSFLVAIPTEGEVFTRLVTEAVFLYGHEYSIAESFNWFWVLKLSGSLLMAISFWMAFSKFPTKE
jgi:hypothetical protein